MSYEFRLRFPVSQIHDLASRYAYVVSDRSLEESIPEVKQRGHLTKADLLPLGWYTTVNFVGRKVDSSHTK